MTTTLLPRLLDLRANTTNSEVYELADILVEMLGELDRVSTTAGVGYTNAIEARKETQELRMREWPTK